MRQETIVRTIATYEELTEEQKKKVIEKLSDINTDSNWYSANFENYTYTLSLLGFSNVEIEFSGFWSQGDGASFTGRFDVPTNKEEQEERLKKAIKDNPNLDLSLFACLSFTQEEIEDGRLDVDRQRWGHYVHENLITTSNESLTDFCKDFSRMIYKGLEDYHDYLTSREAIEETIEANEYEFYTDTLGIA